MLNRRLLLALAASVSLTTSACSSDTSLGQTAPCKPSASQVDRGCNEDPDLPAMAGTCQPDGTCACNPGFVLSATSKRCKLVTSGDAAALVCTAGADQTCNDDGWYSGLAGVCQGGVACACNPGFVLNPATGRCKAGTAADAGADSPTPEGVCTFLVDQTCNDDQSYSGVAGVCTKSGTCSCNAGFVTNPATGRCRAATSADAAAGPDAGPDGSDALVAKDLAGVCTPGRDQTCNDSLAISSLWGRCQSDSTCVCNSGYVINPSTGRCTLPAVADAGPDALPPEDLGSDVQPVCTVGMNQTCNDESFISYTVGVCQPDGTCACNTGYVVNPATGRCMPTAPACSGSYLACGCGCCGGTSPALACYYPSAGDSLDAIVAADRAAAGSSNCAFVGCSMGQQYMCCAEAPPEAASTATYSASYVVGGIDRIGLSKVGTDDVCVHLELYAPGGNSSGFPVSIAGDWTLGAGTIAGSCLSAAPGAPVIGAQGTISFSPSGNTGCAASAHLTVFLAESADGPVTAMRFDVDALPISGGPADWCR